MRRGVATRPEWHILPQETNLHDSMHRKGYSLNILPSFTYRPRTFGNFYLGRCPTREPDRVWSNTVGGVGSGSGEE